MFSVSSTSVQINNGNYFCSIHLSASKRMSGVTASVMKKRRVEVFNGYEAVFTSFATLVDYPSEERTHVEGSINFGRSKMRFLKDLVSGNVLCMNCNVFFNKIL